MKRHFIVNELIAKVARLFHEWRALTRQWLQMIGEWQTRFFGIWVGKLRRDARLRGILSVVSLHLDDNKC